MVPPLRRLSRTPTRPSLLLVLTLGAVACSGQPRPAPPPSSPPAAKAVPAQDRSPRARLLRHLREVDPPTSVLEGVPPDFERQLRRYLEGLSPEQKTELLRGDVASESPLLHLALGGQAPEALYALAAGGAADEVTLMQASTQPNSPLGPSAVEATNRLARNAAALWLQEKTPEFAAPSGVSPTLCDGIARLAELLGRGRLRVAARELAVALEDTPARWLDLARAAAWELETGLSQVALDHARDQAVAGSGESERAAVERLLLQARVAARVRGRRVAEGELEAVSQALIELGRHAEARELLKDAVHEAPSDLGLAARFAAALVDGTLCPGLVTGSDNPMLCAAAWRTSARARQASAVLTQAWRGGQDADRFALEAYLGLVRVAPWLYSLLPDPGRSEAPETPTALEALRGDLRLVAGQDPAFEGLVLFLDALAASLEVARTRQPGERVTLPVESRAGLLERARALAARLPGERFTQAGVIATAALTAQDEDISTLVGSLPRESYPEYRGTRAALELWSAGVSDEAQALDSARTDLMRLVTSLGTGWERSGWILLLAEGDAAVIADGPSFTRLAQVAESIVGAEAPAALALRAVLDLAGSLERMGNSEAAIQVLERLAGLEVPNTPSTELDLMVLGKGALLAMRGSVATGKERAEYAAQLQELSAGLSSGIISTAVAVWVEAWARELDVRVRADKCPSPGRCIDTQRRQRGLRLRDLETRLGKQSARLFERGTLPLGLVKASFGYSGASGLTPGVALDPMLLPVGVPPLS